MGKAIAPKNPLTNKPNQFIYRGQGNASWKLLPSVFREDITNISIKFWKGQKITLESQVYFEWMLLDQFRKQCDVLGLRIINDSYTFREKNFKQPLLGIQFINEWPNKNFLEIMALAQHHGVPTRLLDWSKRSYVAAYFAASSALASHYSGENNTKFAVWALNIESIYSYMNIKIVNVPGSTSNNLAAQLGLFTLIKQPLERYQIFKERNQIFKAKPFEDEFESLPNTPLWKITLPIKYASEVIDLCELYGVSASTLFPGFDGAAMAVKDWINKLYSIS